MLCAACESTRAKDCAALQDVEARIARDTRTYPDPKTPSETAQNWTDEANKLQSERDALERLTFRDERVAVWAANWRDTFPIQARVARRMAEAVKAADWKTVTELQTDWDARQKKIAGVGQDLDAYCSAR